MPVISGVGVAEGLSTALALGGIASGPNTIFSLVGTTKIFDAVSYVLLEDGFRILLEDGSFLQVEGTEVGGIAAVGIGSTSEDQNVIITQEVFLISIAIANAIKEHKRIAIINSDSLTSINNTSIVASPLTIDNGYAEQYYTAWKTYNTDYERRYNMEQVELLFTKLGYNISKQDNDGRFGWKVQW